MIRFQSPPQNLEETLTLLNLRFRSWLDPINWGHPLDYKKPITKRQLTTAIEDVKSIALNKFGITKQDHYKIIFGNYYENSKKINALNRKKLANKFLELLESNEDKEINGLILSTLDNKLLLIINLLIDRYKTDAWLTEGKIKNRYKVSRKIAISALSEAKLQFQNFEIMKGLDLNLNVNPNNTKK